MQEFKIATGSSRYEKKWKNKTVTWQQLLERLAKTTRTAETEQEYRKLSKAKQDNVKDVGGFVGGWLREGRRLSGHVESRSILTLDADYAEPDFWDTYSMLFDWQSLIYSTHKHTTDKPRLRLVVALDRDVSPDEYQAISRKVAEMVGIEQFDDTTHQPTRLMYWPSTSQDGTYCFQSQEGPPLVADELLAAYPDWTDISYWPMSSRETEIRQTRVKRQQDPLDKGGIIGAFCRTYTIQDAIDKYLADIYAPAGADRYTFTGGSSSSGLVVYNDKFAYSNHATDPASGQLCNAFDLVRIHLYSDRDKEAKEDTPPTRLPSYLAMADLARTDADVKLTLGQDKLSKAQAEFADVEADAPEAVSGAAAEEPSTKWLEQLEYSKAGNVENSSYNINLIMQNDPHLAEIGHANLFNGRVEFLQPPKWEKDMSQGIGFDDTDKAYVAHYLETTYNIKRNLDTNLRMIWNENSFHPVKDYLLGLPAWDGEERLETMLFDYLGATEYENEYTQTVMRKFMVGAIKRIFEPGCQMDYMLVLEGKQGIGKSTFVRKISRGWFNESSINIGHKDGYEQLRGYWFIEMAELAAMRSTKVDVEAVKQLLTQTKYSYRPAYAQFVIDVYSQCVYVGTTNNASFLKDKSGNRRFWVVHVDGFGDDNRMGTIADEDIDQIWAEAMVYYKAGEKIYLEGDVLKTAENIQDNYTSDDAWEPIIDEYLSRDFPSNWGYLSLSEKLSYLDYDASENAEDDACELMEITPAEIYQVVLGRRPGGINNLEKERVFGTMQKLGWDYQFARKEGKRVRVFRRKEGQGW